MTGGAGFIGSHLAERLVESGAEVTIVDNLRSGAWENLAGVTKQVRAVDADVRDRETIERIVHESMPDVLFHLAANPSIPASVADPVFDFETNSVGAFNVLNAIRMAGGCGKAVVLSSGAVYGEPESFPIRESDPLKPISPYGASKLHAEVTARMFQCVYGVPAVIARPFNAYGPRMGRFVILDFLRNLQSDPHRLEILGTGLQVRDFAYVSDVVEGLLTLAANGDPGEAYNISSGNGCTVADLAARIVAALGLTAETEIRFTGESWVGDAQRWEVSLDKIRGLGYSAEVGLDEGLRRTIRWFEEREGAIWPHAH